MLENECLKFYEVSDCGCGYEKLLEIFDNKQRAIAFWEEKHIKISMNMILSLKNAMKGIGIMN